LRAAEPLTNRSHLALFPLCS